jgi:hypothetical protein
MTTDDLAEPVRALHTLELTARCAQLRAAIE